MVATKTAKPAGRTKTGLALGVAVKPKNATNVLLAMAGVASLTKTLATGSPATSAKVVVALRTKAVIARIAIKPPTVPTTLPERRAATMKMLHDDLFTHPWRWLGLTRMMWLATPYHERVFLFV